MPTALTHAAVGLTGGISMGARARPLLFWVLCLAVPTLADLDVLAFRVGIPYHHWLGHRGFFHSLSFSLVLGLLSAGLVGRKLIPGPAPLGSYPRRAAFFILLAASHPLLDALTNGGLGVALLSPLWQRRYFMPWTPIQVSPISPRRFFSRRGVRVLWSEVKWVWIPCLALAAACRVGMARQANR